MCTSLHEDMSWCRALKSRQDLSRRMTSWQAPGKRCLWMRAARRCWSAETSGVSQTHLVLSPHATGAFALASQPCAQTPFGAKRLCLLESSFFHGDAQQLIMHEPSALSAGHSMMKGAKVTHVFTVLCGVKEMPVCTKSALSSLAQVLSWCKSEARCAAFDFLYNKQSREALQRTAGCALGGSS